MQATPEQLRFLRHVRKTLPVAIERQEDWLRNLVALVSDRDKLLSVPGRQALFWITLRGVLLDITSDEEERLREVWEDTPAAEERRVAVGLQPETRANHAKVVDALRALRAVLTERELVAVDYLRHSHCHPNVASYRYRFEKQGTVLRDTYQPGLLSEARNIDELRAMVQEQLDEHGDESKLAAAIAAKVEDGARAVLKAFEPLFKAPE
jgi:hypothetical protein